MPSDCCNCLAGFLTLGLSQNLSSEINSSQKHTEYKRVTVQYRRLSYRDARWKANKLTYCEAGAPAVKEEADAVGVRLPDLRSAPLEVKPYVEMSRTYRLHGELGKGAYGAVMKASVVGKTGAFVAVKSAPKDDEDTAEEAAMFWSLSHPLIVEMLGAFEDAKKIHIVMELCNGDTLTKKVSWARSGLRMDVIARYVSQMFAAAAYLHYHAIVHRDIKPDNYLLKSEDKLAPLKLCDFGFACYYTRGQPLTLRVGSPEWVAPEVVNGRYNEKCDIWSLAAVLFYCCVGYPPFNGANDLEILRKVKKGDFAFSENHWSGVKPEFKAIVEDCMVMEPFKRPNAWKLSVPSVKSMVLTDSLAVKLQQTSEHLADFGGWSWSPLFLDWRDGRSMQGLIHRMKDYRGIGVLVVKTGEGDVFGAVSDRWQETAGNFGGGPDCTLFSLKPELKVLKSTGKSKSYVYINSLSKNLPRGLGFGGKLNWWRLWIDWDLEKCYSNVEDLTFEEGSLLPPNSPTSNRRAKFAVEHMEIWGCSK